MQDQNQTPAESESGSFSSTSSANQENQETKNMATIDNNQSNNQGAAGASETNSQAEHASVESTSAEPCCSGCGEAKAKVKPRTLVHEFTAETSHELIMQSQQQSEQGEATLFSAQLAPKPLPKKTGEPGKWAPTEKQVPVSPEAARAEIEARELPTNIYRPAQAPQAKLKGIAAGFASLGPAGPVSIVELARSLKSDVDLIFEWIYNGLEFLPSYGSQKSGIGALIDGCGNSFDQADLLVQLLRQAGYTADYLFGELRMNGAQAADRFGTDPLNVFSASNLLANGGIPNTTVWTGTEWVMDFSHCYVRVNIGGTNYVFDPALKTYFSKTKIDLATAMGYNATTFMNNARSGATINADYVQNMNTANIRSDLDTMAMNLVNWIKTNNSGAAMDDILGGRAIIPNDSGTPIRQTVHPFLKPGSTPTVWTSIPDTYNATLHIVYDTIDITFFSKDLAGKRLTLFFNASHQGELRLDGTLLGTSSAQTPGSWNSVLFEITHPYAGGYGYQYVWHRVWADKPYLLGNSWGNLGAGAKKRHDLKIAELRSQGVTAADEALLGEYMASIWKNWDAMGSQVTDICNRLTNCTTVNQHACGLIGWFDTPLTDIGAVVWSTSALDNNYDQQQYNDTVLAMHGVALESQIFQATARIDGVSTTPLIDIANSAGQKIYDGKTANWTTNVRPNLVNYASGDLDNIKTWYIDNGYRVAIPEDGALTLGSWTGYGYYAIPTFGTFGLIGGALKGGAGSEVLGMLGWETSGDSYRWGDWETPCAQISEPPFTICYGAYGNPTDLLCACDYYPRPTFGYLDSGYGGSVYGGGNSGGFGGGVGFGGGSFYGGGGGGGGLQNPGANVSRDPIDLVSGAFLYEATDLTIGSGDFPYALGFSRSYNSGTRYYLGRLGYGWKHNYQIFAHKDTDGLLGMGYHGAVGAAASIAEIFVCLDIQSDLTKPFDKYITCALANKWFIDNLTENLVTMESGHNAMVFIKLPDGTYASPAGDNGTMVKNVDSTYSYKTLTGTQLNFNADGQIGTWVEPYGVTVSFSYDTAGKLVSVANGLGRQLTLAYTDNFLTSVSDGTGRSVTFTITDGDLVSVTDPNSKVWTHEYDQPGRMVKHFNPANPTVPLVTNIYDSIGRVKEQKDVNLNTWTYYLTGSRGEEVNPNGKGSVLYFNGSGKVIRSVNQLGKKWLSFYDGRNRLVRAVAPEGNASEMLYDSKDRVIQTTMKAKSGSGLADIVTSATYDTLWNKLKTSTDALGRVTTMNYDAANGNLLSVVSPTVTGVGASTVTMTYNGRGQVLTVTSPDGIVNKNTYHATNETLTSTVSDFGVGRLNLTANFGYNSRGDLTSVQDPRGNTTTFTVDVLRRVTEVMAPAPFNFLTKFTFDDNSNQIKVERQTDDATYPWQTTQATYRADGKLLTTTDPKGRISSIQYDSVHRVWKTTDPLNRIVTRSYDDANRLATVTDPAGIVVQTNTYTDNGLVASMKDARNFTTVWTFDGFDRPDKTTYPDATYEQVTSYDANSNPLTLRTRSAATVTLTYDERNRVKTKTPSGQPTVTTVYDIAGRVTTVSTPVVAGDPSSGTFTNYYDTAGRFYREQYPDGLSVTHQLDAGGNVTRTTYPDGYFIDRVFDQLNRLTDIKLNGAGSSAVQFQYDSLSRRTKLTFENGTSTSYGFEDDSSLSTLYQNFVGSNVGFNYSYDDANQMVHQGMTDPANFRWTAPAPGTTAYAAANNLNQYPTVGGTGFTYSTDGSLTNDGVFKYEFNSERMMTRVRNAGTNAIVADYLYDPALRQRQKNVGGTKTNFYYSGWQRLADYDGTSNTLQQRYVYGTGLDEVLIQITSAGVKTYFHGNHQGSVVAITDSAGAVVSRFKYSPYGESPSMAGTTHGYTGQRYDSETGLYYFKMRYYSPKLGRFLQADPIGYAAGSNLYAYVGNSPVSAVDPMGLFTTTTTSWTYQVYIKPVITNIIFQPNLFGYQLPAIKIPINTGGYHASLIATKTVTVTNEYQTGGTSVTDAFVYDFAAGDPIPAEGDVGVTQYRGKRAKRDYNEQIAAYENGTGRQIWTHSDSGEAFARFMAAAQMFNPVSSESNYIAVGSRFPGPGSNSNDYIAYLLDAAGFGQLDGGSSFLPGITTPTRITGVPPAKPITEGDILVDTLNSWTIWKSGKVGG